MPRIRASHRRLSAPAGVALLGVALLFASTRAEARTKKSKRPRPPGGLEYKVGLNFSGHPMEVLEDVQTLWPAGEP